MAVPALAAAAALKEGDVLAGRYRLVAALGEGGMGVVWEARQLTTDKAVAIKVLKGKDGSDAARFLREAKIAAGLSHRHIVQVFDFWEVEGGGPTFMVMERLVGETLGTMLERHERLGVEDALALLIPVASALRAAHAQGIVHRDLKPDNIFLARPSKDDPIDVKVLDFGLARPVTAGALTTAITQTGSVMGTPFYMSPEQMYGEKDIDVRADIWSFGVILYECLSGQLPFDGENFGQVFRSVTLASPRPLSLAAPHVPPALTALVARMLAHDKEARPSIVQVLEQLTNPDSATPLVRDSVTQRMPSAPPIPADLPRPVAAPATMVSSAISVRRAPLPRGRVPSLLMMGTLVAVVFAGGIGASFALLSTPRPAAVELPPPPTAAAKVPPPPLEVEPVVAEVAREAGPAPTATSSAPPSSAKRGARPAAASPTALPTPNAPPKGRGDPLNSRF
jgi:serine/threonine protein kinase